MPKIEIVPLENLVPQESTFEELFDAIKTDPSIELEYHIIAEAVAKRMGYPSQVVFDGGRQWLRVWKPNGRWDYPFPIVDED